MNIKLIGHRCLSQYGALQQTAGAYAETYGKNGGIVDGDERDVFVMQDTTVSYNPANSLWERTDKPGRDISDLTYPELNKKLKTTPDKEEKWFLDRIGGREELEKLGAKKDEIEFILGLLEKTGIEKDNFKLRTTRNGDYIPKLDDMVPPPGKIVLFDLKVQLGQGPDIKSNFKTATEQTVESLLDWVQRHNLHEKNRNELVIGNTTFLDPWKREMASGIVRDYLSRRGLDGIKLSDSTHCYKWSSDDPSDPQRHFVMDTEDKQRLQRMKNDYGVSYLLPDLTGATNQCLRLAHELNFNVIPSPAAGPFVTSADLEKDLGHPTNQGETKYLFETKTTLVEQLFLMMRRMQFVKENPTNTHLNGFMVEDITCAQAARARILG